MKSKPSIACLLFRRVGDSLLATPALRALRDSYPHAEIAVYAESQVARIFQGLPFVTRIVDCGVSISALRLAKLLRSDDPPDIALDFLSDPRSAFACFLSGAKCRIGIGKSVRALFYTHRIAPQDQGRPVYSAAHRLLLAEAAGASSKGLNLEIELTDEEIRWADELWNSRKWKEKRVVAIFPTSRRSYKCWSHEKFAALICDLDREQNVVAVVVGSVDEETELRKSLPSSLKSNDHMILCNGLGFMAAALKKCCLLIGNDGGPKHLACAMNTPTLTIFRSDLWQYWTPPDDPRHVAVADYENSLSEVEVLGVAQRLLSSTNG